MTSKLLALVFSIFTFTATFAQTARRSNVHIGLIYPLSTNGIHAAEYTNGVSLHGLVGVSKNESSFCASGFGNIIRDTAAGFTSAGFFNVIGGSATGMQVAGFFNCVHHNTKGLQAAGFANITDSGDGAQVAGFINVARSNIHGLQLAGFINKAKNANSQIAGFINVAGKVKGVQLAGFINVADSSDNPIGFINIIGNGQKALGITVDESGTTVAAFRSGGRRLYGIVGAGYNYDHNTDLFALQAGIGAHFAHGKYLGVNGEATVTSLTDFWCGSYMNTTVRIIPSFRLSRFEIFAGPGISFGYSPYGTEHNILNNKLWHRDSYPRNNNLFFGFMSGIQFHL